MKIEISKWVDVGWLLACLFVSWLRAPTGVSMANRIPTPCSCLPHPKSTPSNQTNELAIATGKCLVTIDSLLLLLVWLLNERNSFQTFKIALLHVHCTQPKELLKKKKKMGDKNGNEINVLKCIIVELRFFASHVSWWSVIFSICKHVLHTVHFFIASSMPFVHTCVHSIGSFAHIHTNRQLQMRSQSQLRCICRRTHTHSISNVFVHAVLLIQAKYFVFFSRSLVENECRQMYREQMLALNNKKQQTDGGERVREGAGQGERNQKNIIKDKRRSVLRCLHTFFPHFSHLLLSNVCKCMPFGHHTCVQL